MLFPLVGLILAFACASATDIVRRKFSPLWLLIPVCLAIVYYAFMAEFYPSELSDLEFMRNFLLAAVLGGLLLYTKYVKPIDAVAVLVIGVCMPYSIGIFPMFTVSMMVTFAGLVLMMVFHYRKVEKSKLSVPFMPYLLAGIIVSTLIKAYS